MKIIPIIITLLGALTFGFLLWFSGWGLFIWSMGTKALPDDIGFGYYRQFNVARRNIQQSGCADLVEYSRHEDFTLEEFHFKIRVTSGLSLRLWFNEGMDVGQVCSKLDGFIVLHPRRQFNSQAYTPDELATQMSAKEVHITNLNDVLCNADELARFFEANYTNNEIRRMTAKGDIFNRYLHIEILDPERANDFLYSNVR